MADLDRSDPSEWKREGFTPADRLAWWEAGFAFEDALQLARSGMSPAEAAWHGHEKLKELRAKSAAKTEAQPAAAPALNPEAIWEIIAPHVKAAGLAALAFCAVLAAYLLRRRSQMHRKRSADRHKGPGAHHPARQEPGVAAPISEAPASAAPESVPPSQDTAANTTSVPDQAAQKRSGRPARRYALIRSANPHCIHCKSTNVRTSRIQPHKFAGINFTEYFRCKHCGKHFAIVSYTPILLVAGSIILTLTALTVGLLYAVSGK
jgi:ribosomal protein L37AE/L43A